MYVVLVAPFLIKRARRRCLPEAIADKGDMRLGSGGCYRGQGQRRVGDISGF